MTGATSNQHTARAVSDHHLGWSAMVDMMGLKLAERGVFSTVLILIDKNGGPIMDSRLHIAAWCGCSIAKLNPILDRLIESGRLKIISDSDRAYIAAPEVRENPPLLDLVPGTRNLFE